MTVAERTREAVRARPFLHAALRAGIVNYTAAARFLDVGDADDEAVAAALRRYAGVLPDYDDPSAGGADGRSAGGRVRVDMRGGVGATDDPETALLTVGDVAFAPDEGSLTAILAVGALGPDDLSSVLARLGVEETGVRAAGAATAVTDGDDGHLAVVVGRRDGPDALRLVEDVLGVG